MRTVTLLITIVALAVAAPAIADKGGNGHGNGGGSTPSDPSISIAAVNGAAAPTSSAPGHGSTVTFATTSGSLAGWEYPMVELSCYQDVNRDGTVDTNLLGPDLVYVQLDHPDATFTVAGGSWAAGAATCHARLLAYGWKGGQESIRLLAATYDWTATW